MSVWFIITGLIAFAVSIMLATNAARALFLLSSSKTIGIIGAAFASAVLSVVLDFTLSFAAEAYDRSFSAAASRAGMAAVLGLIVGFFALRRLK